MSNKSNNKVMSYSFFLTVLYITTIIKSIDCSENEVNNSPSPTCEKLIKEYRRNKEELKSQIIKNMFLLKSESKCLELLVTKGLREEAEVLMIELNKRGIKFTDHLRTATNNIIQKAKSIYNQYRFDESDYVTVFPAFEWAQSLDRVFINIKYSHRWDAPGCNEVKKEHVESFENLVMFTAYCIQGDTPIKFTLNLDLYDNVDEKESKYTSSSVGRYQLSLKKEKSGYWKNIVRKGADLPSNMRTWLEMREKYLSEIQKYLDEVEEQEDNNLEEEIEVLKRKRSKKTDL